MKAEYQRSLAHCYMILSEEGCEVPDNYQIRMLASSGIDGILPVAEEHIDNVQRFRYEITSLMPFRDYCEIRRFRVEDLRTLFGGIMETLVKAEDYLLETEHLLLDPEYLYVSWDTGRLWAAYDPFHRNEIREGLTELTEYLLIKIGHGNQDAVVLTCRFLHSLQEKNLGYTELRKLLEQGVSRENGQENESVNQMTEKMDESQSSSWEISDSITAEMSVNPLMDTEERRSSWCPEKDTIITTLILIPVAIGLYAALQLQTLLTLSKWESMGSAVAFGVAVIVSVLLSRRTRKNVKKQEHKSSIEYEVDQVEEDESALQSPSPVRETYSETEEFQNWYGGAEDAEELRAEHTMLLGSIRLTPEGEKEWLLVPVDETLPIPTIPLVGGELLIGKSGGPSDCPIPDPTVSRVHARLVKKDGVWYVSDMSSKNGTSVDGKKAVGREELPLMEGSRVAFARCEYVVQVK